MPHRFRHRNHDSEPGPNGAPEGWPAGHFYSPVVSSADVERYRGRVYAAAGDVTLPGIDLDLDAQLATLGRIAAATRDQPWQDAPQASLRYGFANDTFGPGESLVLLGRLAEIRPRRLIEVGCGWSTRAMLDIRDRVLGGALSLTTIDPYAADIIPELMATDGVRVIESPVQEVGLERFASLEAGDVLFIDSSHVVKFGSDVHFLLAEVLPRLAPGVHVHVHDVLYPFEYPLTWVREGRNWNEAYALRAFLAFNSAFTIDLFAAYVWSVAPERAAALLPLAAQSPGSSLWMHRV